MIDIQTYDSSVLVPPPEVIEAMEGGLVEVVRRIEFYESDATTRWNPSAPDSEVIRLLEGAITVDYHSDERRKLDLKLENIDMKMRPNPNGGLWYDKVIKAFRGVRYASADVSTPLAIIESPSEAEARKVSQILSGMGFDKNAIILDEDNAGSLAAYSWIVSSLTDTATAKASLLDTLYKQGKNIITIGTGSGTAQLPHYATESTTATEPHVLYNEFRDPLFETLTYVYVYNLSTETLVAVTGEGNVVRVDPPAGSGLRAMLYPTPWGPNEPIATRVRLRRNPDVLLPAVITNTVANPGMEDASGLVTVATNLLVNPSAEGTGGWLSNNGTIYAVTDDTTVSHSGAMSKRSTLNPDQVTPMILSMYAVGSDGWRNAVTEGLPYSAGVWTRVGQAGFRARASIVWYDASNASLGQVFGDYFDCPAGEWVFPKFENLFPPENATQCYVMPVVSTADFSNATPGDYANVDDAILVQATEIPDYFSGDTPDTADEMYGWSGAAHASTSVWQRTLVADYNRSNVIVGKDSTWKASGSNSLRVRTIEAAKGAYIYPRYPGLTYHPSAQDDYHSTRVRIRAIRPVGLRLSLYQYDSSNTYVGNDTGPLVALATGEEITLERMNVRATKVGVAKILWLINITEDNGLNPQSIADYFQVDEFMTVNHGASPTTDTTLSYVDGDIPDDDTHTYSWTGTPHASTSIKSLIPKMTFSLIPYNGGSGVGGSIDVIAGVPITKDWFEFDLNGVTPDVVMDRVGLQFIVEDTPEGFEFDLAEATFVKLDSVPEQFSGDTLAHDNYTYSWEGVVNDSRSIRSTSIVTWGIDPVANDSPTVGTFVSESATPRAAGTRPLTLAAGAQALAVWSDDPSAQIITAAFAYGPNSNLWLDIHLPNVNGFEAKKLLRAALYHMKNRVPFKTWETQLGEFYIDGISAPEFPDEVSITARDGTKKLLNSKLSRNSIFVAGTSLKDLIVGQAALGGIPVNKMHFDISGETLTSEMAFERGTSRWEIIKSALESFNYERFFDGRGNFVVRKYLDPSTSPAIWEFGTGPQGNLVSFQKSVNDSRIYNHVIVTADPSDQAADPIGYFGEALNEDPSSPTRTERLGNRVLPIDAPWLSSDEDCVALAIERLKITSLESYELDFSSIYYPWLECGEIITILDPDALDFEPSRFLMDTIAFPLSLGPMSATGKRVTFVGSSGGTGG